MTSSEKTIEIIKISNTLLNYAIFVNNTGKEDLLDDVLTLLGENINNKLELLALSHIDTNTLTQVSQQMATQIEKLIKIKEIL